MSSPNLDDTPSIQQTLSEENIFLLVKRLSQSIQNTSKRNKVNENCKSSKCQKPHHFQVYEKLLQNCHQTNNDGLNLDQRLVACISELDLQDDKIKDLAHHLENLHLNPHAEVILHFLLCLANYDSGVSKYPKKATRTIGIFQCPPEMLDGSLFEQRPNYEGYDNGFSDAASQVQFNLLPGSNLKLARKFFDLYGVPVENNQVGSSNRDQDLGYSSPPESVIGWDEIVALGPLPRHRTWECFGHLIPHHEKPLFSEAGVLKPALNQQRIEHSVTMQQLQRDLTFLLCGITSTCFPFSQDEQKFVFADGLNVSGLTSQVVEKMFRPMLECGRCHRQLENFTDSPHSEDGLIVKALCVAVKKFLVLHREASQRLFVQGGVGFSQLLRGMRWLGPPLTAVSSLCCQPQALHGTELLEQLCAQTALLPPGRTACVFYSLLKHAAEAYFRILKTWLFEGEIEAEGASEFFVQLRPSVLSNRNRIYWTQGFVLLGGRVPGFLQGFEEQLLMCGKAVRFLKLCNPKDPLVCELRSEQPNVTCCLQQLELVTLQQECEKYEAYVRSVCGEPVTACSQMEQSSEQKEAFFEMVRQVHDQRVKEIRAKQQTQREAANKERQRLREELQQQMEEVKARKAEFKKRESEEEEERQRILEVQQAQYDQRQAEEREKVLRHYEDLSKEADVRMKRTQRKIELLKHELHEELSDAADVNSNSVNNENASNTSSHVTDNNANLPVPTLEIPVKSPRKIPTSLPLKQTKHLEDLRNANEINKNIPSANSNINLNSSQEEIPENAQLPVQSEISSDAARNKARVLQHELNLITNYNDITSIEDASQDKNLQQPNVSEIHSLNKMEAARNKAKVLQHECINDNANIPSVDLDTCQVKELQTENTPQRITNATEMNNLNSTEAARNKAKVLQHELNLITNYGDTEVKSSPPGEVTIAMQIKNKILRDEFGILADQRLDERKCVSDLGDAYNMRNIQAAKNRARANQGDGEWNIATTKNNKDSSPTSESLVSPCSSSSSAQTDLEDKQETSPVTDVPYSVMTVSMTSIKTDVETPSGAFPSVTTDLETPSSTYPSAMTTSYDTTSGANLPSPGSALMSTSAMTTSYDTTSGANLPSPGSAMMTSSAMTNSKLVSDTPMSETIPKLPTSVSTASFLSAMSLLSEPFKWNVSHNKETLSSTVKELNISTSHLSHLLRQTISTVLSMQVKLVNQSVLKLLLHNEQLLEHFDSFRHYFLFIDGEFARHITESLCVGMELNKKKPRSLLNFVSLDSILNHALTSSIYGSKDPNATRLSLGMRFEPTEFHLYAPDTLNCVQLQYQVSWPLNLIINPEALDCYDKIFNFLLGLRRGVWAVDKSFQLLQESYTSMDLKRSPQYHRLRLFRHDMGCFMQAFHSYIMNFAVLQCWKNHEKILKTAKTLDDLYKIHARFLKQVIFYCLLKRNAEAIQKVLQSVVKSVLKFYRQLSAHTWCKIDGEFTHPAFSQLTQTYDQYKARTQLFLRHMTKIASRGHQTVLFELLHVLNMNEFYGIKL